MAASLAVTVAAGGGFLVNGAANADPPPGSLGSLTLEPETGFDFSVIEVVTSAGCPTTADSYNVIVTGPNGFNLPMVSTTDIGISFDGPFEAPFVLSMKAAADQQGIALATGEYDVDLRCVEGFTNTSFGNFTTAMFFTVTPTSATYTTPTTPTPTPTPVVPTPTPEVTPTPVVPTPTPEVTPTPVVPTPTPEVTPTPVVPTPTPEVTPTPVVPTPTPEVTPTPVVPTPTPEVTPTPTPQPGAQDTATALKVIKINLPGPGGLVLPLAFVSPTNAAGTVQFKDRNTNLGGPRLVLGGIAIGNLTFLGSGEHTITAVFTPANPAVFKPSTSNAVKVRF